MYHMYHPSTQGIFAFAQILYLTYLFILDWEMGASTLSYKGCGAFYDEKKHTILNASWVYSMMIFKDKKQTQAGCEAFYDGEEEIGTEDHAGYTQAIQPYFLF